MISIIDNFFEEDLLKKVQNHVTNRLQFTPRYFEGTTEKTKENYYGDRYDLIQDKTLQDIFIKNTEKKFNIKIKKIHPTSGIDLRNLDILKPHTDDKISKMNILIMLKGSTAVTNGTVFYTNNNLDIHVGFKENRALMFPSNKVHSPHASNIPNLKRFTATLFLKDYEE